MHWNCVVIIPPESARNDIPEMIAGIMEPFEGDWWDWYKIGGCFTADGAPAVRRLADISPHETAERVIVADPTDYRLTYMTQREFWNGVNAVRSAWDGRVMSAVVSAQSCSMTQGVRMVDAEWLAVTVDYHS